MTAVSQERTGTALEKEKTNLGFLADEDGELVLALDTEVVLTTVRPETRELLVEEATQQVFRAHKLLDGYHYYQGDAGNRLNNLRVVNESWGAGPVEVDPFLFDAVEKSLRMAELTCGFFNPTVGLLVDAYEGKFESAGSIQQNPSSSRVQEALRSVVPYEKLRECVVLDTESSTIELLPCEGREYKLALGAIAKGYALDRLAFSRDTSYLITAGSSSIATHRAPGEDLGWNVAVHVPDGQELLVAFHLDDGFLSTSGDDENYYFTADGTRVHHILNPFTGYSENHYRNVVLVGQDAAALDALSTALFNVGDIDKACALIRQLEDEFDQEISYCFVQDDDDGFLLTMDRNMSASLLDEYTHESARIVLQ